MMDMLRSHKESTSPAIRQAASDLLTKLTKLSKDRTVSKGKMTEAGASVQQVFPDLMTTLNFDPRKAVPVVSSCRYRALCKAFFDSLNLSGERGTMYSLELV